MAELVMKYQQYAEYKDSGVEWLGEIPKDWVASKFAYVKTVLTDFTANGSFADLKKNVVYRDEPSYARLVRLTDLRINLDDRSGVWIDQKAYNYLRKSALFGGEFLLANVGAHAGLFYQMPENKGNASLAPNMFMAKFDSNKVLREFIAYVAQGQSVNEQLRLNATASSAQPKLNKDDFKSVRFTYPSIEEQTQIANFLDHETAQIDTLIEKQQTLIQLLKEKRQAVISHAVTKGLNPDAPMKDSGVEWLGEVPEHWDVTKAKYVSDIFIPQRNKPELNAIEGCPWVTMEDMKSQYIDEVHRYVKSEAMQESGSKVLKAGAVIASCVGNFGVTSINRVDVIINQQLQAFQPKRIKPEYLQAIVALSKSYFELIGTAATLVYVNREGFENLPVIVPTTQEQEAISKFINIKSKQFDLLVSRAEQAIQLMQERRTALISAAVTGKIDVRGWVAPN